MGSAFPIFEAAIGSNFAGIVVAIASDTKTDLVLGDTVAGGFHGSNPGQQSRPRPWLPHWLPAIWPIKALTRWTFF